MEKEGEGQLTLKFTQKGNAITTETRGEASANMLLSGICSLTRILAKQKGDKNLDDTISQVLEELSAMASEVHDLDVPDEIAKMLEARICATLVKGHLSCQMKGGRATLITLVASLVGEIAGTEGQTIAEVQADLDAALRFLGVQRGEVKKTLQDRKEQLRVSFLKSQIFGEG